MVEHCTLEGSFAPCFTCSNSMAAQIHENREALITLHYTQTEMKSFYRRSFPGFYTSAVSGIECGKLRHVLF